MFKNIKPKKQKMDQFLTLKRANIGPVLTLQRIYIYICREIYIEIYLCGLVVSVFGPSLAGC